mmetsp:Transcript_88751/g.236247  ORF Transcript_88751/g.236247 Transcript_88751/m.236247 type:complete len:632 (+) Transcript_88751:98-1993(+)
MTGLCPGERCSCTTAVTELISRNFDLKCDSDRWSGKPESCVIGGLPWKHDFMRRADLAKADETLHVLVTRHPYEWIDSMRRNGFYTPFHKGLPMDKFLTLEWLSLDMNPSNLPRIEKYLRTNAPMMVNNPKRGRRLLSLASGYKMTDGRTRPTATVRSRHRELLPGHRPHDPPTPRRGSPGDGIPGCDQALRRRDVEFHTKKSHSGASCLYFGTEYSCVPFPFPSADGSRDKRTPAMRGCLFHDVSAPACSGNALLCQRNHPFLYSLDLSTWARVSETVRHARGTKATKDSFEDILSFGKGIDDLRAAKRRDLLSSRAVNCAGARSCFVMQDSSKHATESFAPKSTFECCKDNRTYQCILVPGSFYAHAGQDMSPSRFCHDAASSFAKCGDGLFLCRADSQEKMPWNVDPVAWHRFSDFLAGASRQQLIKPFKLPPVIAEIENMSQSEAGSLGTFKDSTNSMPSGPVFPWKRNSGSGSADLSFAAPPIASFNAVPRRPYNPLGNLEVKELLKDRNPETGDRFPNVLAMREAKLRDWLRVSSKLLHNHHTSCRDFMLDPMCAFRLQFTFLTTSHAANFSKLYSLNSSFNGSCTLLHMATGTWTPVCGILACACEGQSEQELLIPRKGKQTTR